MISINNLQNIFLKIIFDGYDFLQSEIGYKIIPTHFQKSVISNTFSTNYNNKDEFVEWCKKIYKNADVDHYVAKELTDKYNVGLYKLKDWNNPENPWNNRHYILFNPILEQLFELFPHTKDIQFYVCPSENGIGFRIVDPELVLNSFKWLFMSGNNIIYGKPEKDCYVVEGFRDYVALKECGYKVIGLGSVKLSKLHEEILKDLNPTLLLDNDKFGLQQSLNYLEKGYKVSTLKSKYKDAYDTWINTGKIEIIEVQ